MGKLRNEEYYDNVYSTSQEYSLHYKESCYYVVWVQVLQFLKRVDNPRVLEIGCGTGQLADYLYDEGYRNYHGFDFSAKAILIANKTVNLTFSQGDALNEGSYHHDYNVVITLEVMEHVGDDLAVIHNIKQDTPIIFSLPTFDDPSHVRWFNNIWQIIKRYYKCIDIKEIVPVKEWFVCFGVVKNFNPGFLNRVFRTREQITLRNIARKIYRSIKGYRIYRTL